MEAFEAELKRAFAETADPVDDGFAVKVAGAVDSLERRRAWLRVARFAAFGLGILAAAFGAVQLFQGVGLALLADLGLGVARLHGELSAVELAAPAQQSVMGLGLTQILLLTFALAGGAYAARRARD